MKKYLFVTILNILVIMMAGCSDDPNYVMNRPDVHEHPELTDIAGFHSYKAPLYWSIYEACLDQQDLPVEKQHFSLEQWKEVIDWVATELKPHGYDMVCTDGFLDTQCVDGIFKTHYGGTAYRDIIDYAHSKGLKVGIYDIPMTYTCAERDKVPGTEYSMGSLLYNPDIDEVINPKANEPYKYIVMSHPGAREYIRALIRYYKELGADFLRFDYLSHYEDGFDRNNIVGKGYGRQNYADLLETIALEAKEQDIMVSLVMPHLYNDAEIEKRYGHMIRIVRDTWTGGWLHTSSHDRGKIYNRWSNLNNQFDGFTYWSHLSGRDKVILDGDFTIAHSFETDAEKKFCISIQLMAGGPIAVADQPGTIGDNLKYYTNDEMLALNHDRFVGKPLSDVVNSEGSNVWYGQMSNGDYIVGLFNREDNPKVFNVAFADLGISSPMKVRDLWEHADEGTASAINAQIEPHGCKIVRLSK
ncbi:glucan 1,6-alpha-isomaltosidase [Barnesiella viscericola]|uniref:alpha-galactosidase n=1 Tax=Barnesiella viscericola TaxID=397865 RepID=UPI0025A365AD|nr:glucan 1,6-alpha-isomaltosidase [Barnesiella viscericola]MDM8268840.1 glucan 1,6-alpha-isomaltosidase [Barnesiella viscericola]